MNQTKKRLAIIKLAISMTDAETIQLQVLKLGMLKTDNKMKEILAMLNEQNYAQAQELISSYIEAPQETTIVQRTPQKENSKPTPESIESKIKPQFSIEAMIQIKEESQVQEKEILTIKEKIQQAKDQAIIDQFELFTQDENEEEYKQAENYDALLDTTPKTISTKDVNYDALLKVDIDDVLPDNIKLDISQDKQNISIQEIQKYPKDKIEHINTKKINKTIKDVVQYKAISYIEQKLENMTKHYPPIEQNEERFTSSNAWLQQITQEGYTEKEVEEVVKHVEKLSADNKAEAAQLILITGATESKYAQFQLARALFKGEILQKNPNEAVNLINDLAIKDNYPEAICDLAQFYENGLGVEKNTKKAEILYKDAMELGIQRAINGYERVRKGNKGFFSGFKKY